MSETRDLVGGAAERLFEKHCDAELMMEARKLAHATADHKEVVAAFAEKRKPEFGGA